MSFDFRDTRTLDQLLESYTFSDQSDSLSEDYAFVTHELYCEALDAAQMGILTESYFEPYLDEGIWDEIKKLNVASQLVSVFKEIQAFLVDLKDSVKIGISDLVEAFKQRDVFAVLKVFGFSIMKVFKVIQAATGFVRQGILKIFEEIHKTGMIQKLQKGVIKIDEFMDKYPLLKKVTGIAIAGLLIYIWLNMSFIGDPEFDLDLSVVAGALSGNYTLADLFLSPSGLAMLALLATGAMGLLFPWLGAKVYNTVLAFAYTGFKKIKSSPQAKMIVGRLQHLLKAV
jgi:hypothetical protein